MKFLCTISSVRTYQTYCTFRAFSSRPYSRLEVSETFKRPFLGQAFFQFCGYSCCQLAILSDQYSACRCVKLKSLRKNCEKSLFCGEKCMFTGILESFTYSNSHTKRSIKTELSTKTNDLFSSLNFRLKQLCRRMNPCLTELQW